MMVISILPIASKTAYADESGTPGNPWHIEKLDGISVVTAWLTSDDINKTLHISGTGNMKDFIADDHPWKEDREKITTIVFEEEGSVTSIGKNAFVGCTALTRITIDSSVAHIGKDAFNGCGNLSKVIFRPAAEEETLTIADNAFATNQKLAYGSASMMRLYYGGNAIQAKADLSDYNNKPLTWKAYSYHLSVGGVEVTDSNKDNIFEDSGTVRASYNPESNTLKLNGVNIQPDDNNRLYGIYYNGTDALNIYLESGSENIVGVNNFAYGFIYGIYSTENAKISFSGTGKLKVTAGNGGTCSGIFAKGDMEINGSTVTSAASGYYNNGIVAKNLTINGGTVVSSANDLNEDTTTHGISVDTLVINTGAELTAIGKAGAISGAVKNAIAGTGWTDTAGIEGRTTISIKTEGKPLDGSIKKVQFPDDSVHIHDNVTFQPWTSTNSLPTKTGSYYLTEDVTLTSLNNWKIPEGVTIDLCLNGHNIVYKNVYNYYPVIQVRSGAALNLYDCSENPGKISNNDSTGVDVYGTFTMNGGVITGCTRSGVIINDGTFTMNGGSITGNTCSGSGAGVNIGNGKSFVMNGGSITNNSAGKRGGGVYIYEGSFTMNGGTITGNSAKDLGGGVYVDGSFVVKGDINITNNKSGNDGHTDNVYLYKSGSNYNKIAFSGTLSQGSKIGVTLGSNYSSEAFTSGYKTYYGTTDPKTVFTDDAANSNYGFYIKYNGEVARLRHYTVTISPTEHGTVTADKNESPVDKYVKLTVTPDDGYHVSSLIYKYTNYYGEVTEEVVNNQIYMPPYNITVYATFVSHEHNFTYSADGATITAECTAEDCDLPVVDGKHIATLTIAAAGGTYDGTTSFGATITDANAIQGDAKVVYQKKNGESYGEATETAPTDAGDYKASITLGSGDNTATASVEYTIAKAGQTISAEDVTATYGDTDKAVSASVTDPTTVSGAISYAVKTGSGDYIDIDSSTGKLTIKKAGTAIVVVTAAETDNYSKATYEVTVTINKATAPAVDTPTPDAVTYDLAKTLSSVTLPEGWTWTDDTVVPTVNNTGYDAELAVDDGNYDYTGVEGYDSATHKVTRTVTLTVNKADSAAATVSANNRTYDATEKPLVTVSGEASGGTMNYALGENGTTAPTDGWSEEIPSAVNAKTYYVWYKVSGDENHNDTDAVPVEVKVNTATLTVAAVNQNIKVGDEVPDISNPVLDTHYTVTGLVGEDTLTTAPTLTYKKGGSKVTPDSSKAGTYDIVASDAVAGSNYTVTHTDAKLTISNKEVQTISAENVTATVGETGKKVTATTSGDGQISYAVKTGSEEYIDIHPSSGALTIKKEGTATVVVTAAETPTYAKATKEVTVTINPVDKSKLQSAINAAKAFYNSIKDLPVYEATAREVKSQIEAAEKALEEGKTQQSVNEAESTLNNALAADLKKVADLLPGTDKATLDNEEAIKAAYSAYNAMTDTQKTLADEDTKNKIREDRVLMINIRNGHYYADSGDGGRWTRGSGSTLPFVFKHSAVDDVTYRSFRSIKVDGRMVYEYTYIKGSVKIDLLPDYLKTLSLGDHTLTAEFAGGMSATASFRVLKESSGGGDTPYIPPKTGIE